MAQFYSPLFFSLFFLKMFLCLSSSLLQPLGTFSIRCHAAEDKHAAWTSEKNLATCSSAISAWESSYKKHLLHFVLSMMLWKIYMGWCALFIAAVCVSLGVFLYLSKAIHASFLSLCISACVTIYISIYTILCNTQVCISRELLFWLKENPFTEILTTVIVQTSVHLQHLPFYFLPLPSTIDCTIGKTIAKKYYH